MKDKQKINLAEKILKLEERIIRYELTLKNILDIINSSIQNKNLKLQLIQTAVDTVFVAKFPAFDFELKEEDLAPPIFKKDVRGKSPLEFLIGDK